MGKCGPVHDQSRRASSERPIQSPLRVPTITKVSLIRMCSLRLSTPRYS